MSQTLSFPDLFATVEAVLRRAGMNDLPSSALARVMTTGG